MALTKEFKWLKKKGNLSTFEMLKVFNCGIGMIVLVEKDYVDEVIQYANNENENCFVIGEMVEKCESSVFLKETLKNGQQWNSSFISGRGSNLNAIINAVNDGVIKYPILQLFQTDTVKE